MVAYIYLTYRPDTEEFYIGRRIAAAYDDPLDDVEYLGSGQWIREMKETGISLKEEIIVVCETKEELAAKERAAISMFLWHLKCCNIHAVGGHVLITCACGKYQLTLNNLEDLYVVDDQDHHHSVSFSTWMFSPNVRPSSDVGADADVDLSWT